MAKRLQANEEKQLKEWIRGQLNKNVQLELIYKGTRDTFNATRFHQLCDNQGPTVCVVYNTAKFIFGGFTNESWQSTNAYKNDPNAFLFRLQSNGNFNAHKYAYNGNGQSIYAHANYGPTFGGGHDMCVFTNNVAHNGQFMQCNNHCNVGTSYTADAAGVAGFTGNNLQIEELEIYAAKEAKNVAENPPWRKSDTKWTDAGREQLHVAVSKYSPPESTGVRQVRILFVGPVGAGKSSFFNTINSVFKGYVTSRPVMGEAAHSLTTKYRAYEIRSETGGGSMRYRLCDSMGLEEDLGLNVKDVALLLDGHIPDRYQFNPIAPMSPKQAGYSSSPKMSEKIHCLVVVLDGTMIDVLPKPYLEKIRTVQEDARNRGIPLVALVTKIDKVCEEVAKDLSLVYHSPAIQSVVESIAGKLGLPKINIVPVKNYESEDDLVANVDILAMKALQKMLRCCDDFLEEYVEEIMEENMSNFNIKK